MKPLGSHTSGVETVDEAVDALGRYGSDAKVLAGGQSLVPLMNLRLARPAILVDVNRVRSLSGIRHDSSSERVVIGACTRHRLAERDPLVFAGAPCWPRRSATSGTMRFVPGERSAAAPRTPTPPPRFPQFLWRSGQC